MSDTPMSPAEHNRIKSGLPALDGRLESHAAHGPAQHFCDVAQDALDEVVWLRSALAAKEGEIKRLLMQIDGVHCTHCGADWSGHGWMHDSMCPGCQAEMMSEGDK